MEGMKTDDLTPIERDQLQEVMKGYPSIFSTNPGRTTVAQQNIYVTDATPLRQKPYRLPYSRWKVVEEEVQKMLEARAIHPSSSPWSSPIVLVEKKDESVRFCVDFRKLNSVTKFDIRCRELRRIKRASDRRR